MSGLFGGSPARYPTPEPLPAGPTAAELAAQKQAEEEAARAARNRYGRRKTVVTGGLGDLSTPETSTTSILTGSLKEKLGD